MNSIVFLDTETTGVDKTKDEVIELAIIEFNTKTNSNLILYHSKFLPSVPINPEAELIHGISLDSLKHCLKFSQCSEIIQKIIEGHVLAGHNVSFDLEILNRQLVESGQKGIPINTETVDTFLIEKMVNSHKLTEVYKRYCGEEYSEAHSALNDTIASIEILKHQMIINHLKIEDVISSKVKNLLGYNTTEWLDYGHYFYRTNENNVMFGFGKHKGEEAYLHPSYLQWMLNNQFGHDTKKICQEILDMLEAQQHG